MTAKSWDSYKETVYAVLDRFKPRFILEFGPGFSTGIFATNANVERVVSLEHDKEYYNKFIGSFYSNVQYVYEPDIDLYAQFKPEFTPDLIFIDGRNRSRCLREVRTLCRLIILHDSAREQYQEAISEYDYKIWADEGNTVCLTNDVKIYEVLQECLNVRKNSYTSA